MIRAVLLVALVFVASSTATDVKACSGGRPLPISVDIEGCALMPCDVIKGTTAIMQVNFVGTRDNIQKITAKVSATALGITGPYVLPDDVADVCSNLLNGASCPIDKGEDVIYNFRFAVDNSYPEIPVKVEISLVDDATNQSVACFVTDIRVKKGSA